MSSRKETFLENVNHIIAESNELIELNVSFLWEGRIEDLLAKIESEKAARDATRPPRPAAATGDTIFRRGKEGTPHVNARIVRTSLNPGEGSSSDTSLKDINKRQSISGLKPPTVGQLVKIIGDDPENYGKLVTTLMDGPTFLGVVVLKRPLKGHVGTVVRAKFDNIVKYNPEPGDEIDPNVRRAQIVGQQGERSDSSGMVRFRRGK